MTVRLTGDWSKLDGAFRALSRLSFTDLHKKIGAYLLDDVQERFRRGVGPDGRPWRPSRRAREEGGQTLVDSRLLENSISYRASPHRLDLGTNSRYARVHQFGGTIRPRRARALRFQSGGRWYTVKKVVIPARPYLGLSDENVKECGEIVDEAVRKAVER